MGLQRRRPVDASYLSGHSHRAPNSFFPLLPTPSLHINRTHTHLARNAVEVDVRGKSRDDLHPSKTWTTTRERGEIKTQTRRASGFDASGFDHALSDEMKYTSNVQETLPSAQTNRAHKAFSLHTGNSTRCMCVSETAAYERGQRAGGDDNTARGRWSTEVE